jgi:sarcosine oxidase, subunit beta
MAERADVVVVGAGVVGASVAWHLATLGVREILVLDRGSAPGEGSSGRATGGFRAQFGTAINVRLSLFAREKLRRFPDEVGADPGYRPCGYLWLATSPAELDALRAAQRVQREAGLAEARMVEPAGIAQLNPAASLTGVAGGAFCPSDGFLRPLSILRGYLDGARRLGARIRFGEEVTGLPRSKGGRIDQVRLGNGEISCGTVVNAAGAWAGALGRLAGTSVPVAPLRRQVACTVPCTALPEEMPMTLWAGDGFHVRVRDGRVLLLRPTPGASDPFQTEVEEPWIREVQSIAARRLPSLAGVAIDRPRCWAGLYEMSPDGHALLGRAPGCENLVLVNGSSGHGVMHAPALGALAAELIVHGAPRSLDVRELRPSRFEEGAPLGGHGLL